MTQIVSHRCPSKPIGDFEERPQPPTVQEVNTRDRGSQLNVEDRISVQRLASGVVVVRNATGAAADLLERARFRYSRFIVEGGAYFFPRSLAGKNGPRLAQMTSDLLKQHGHDAVVLRPLQEAGRAPDTQCALFEEPRTQQLSKHKPPYGQLHNGSPELTSYDLIIVNSSGGKDSQAALAVVCELAEQHGVSSRVVVIHNDMGRSEWQGTVDTARAQAEFHGVRFIVTPVRPQGDLIQHALQRGKWPSPSQRWCTSDHKRGQALKQMTQLVDELDLGRPAMILNCLGLRSYESSRRASAPSFVRDIASNKNKRFVDRWLPIHGWTSEQVWDKIAETGSPHAAAYDQGVSRNSCVACIFNTRQEAVHYVSLNPALGADMAEAEQAMGHQFTTKWSIGDVATEAGVTTAQLDAARKRLATNDTSLGLDLGQTL